MKFEEFMGSYDIQYVETIEQEMIQAGCCRMSVWFGKDYICENKMAVKHILWDRDEYYYFVCMNPQKEESVLIWYSDSLEENYELLDEFLLTATEVEVKKRIKKILGMWKPKQERILKKYIKLDNNNRFPYNVYSLAIYMHNGKSIVGIETKWENTKENKFILGIKPNMDGLYKKYLEEYNKEDYKAAIFVLCELYELSLKELGKNHSNTVVLLEEFILLAEEVEGLTANEILSVNLLLYNFYNKKYGNNHYVTICKVSDIAYNLADLEQQEEAIVLAGYVYKAFVKKYGKTDEKTLKAQRFLIWHYMNYGRVGKALSIAEECLELCKIGDRKNLYRCYQYIAGIHRDDRYEDSIQLDKAIYYGYCKIY